MIKNGLVVLCMYIYIYICGKGLTLPTLMRYDDQLARCKPAGRMWDKKKNEEMDDLIVVSRQGDSFFFMSVKLETASYICIINWTVMLFYKHLCSFWKRYSCMYASILVQLSSFVHHFLFFALLSFFLFIGIFFSSLSITEKERRHHIIAVVFSLSQPKILPASVHTYISIRRSASACAPFFFSSCIGQI